MKALRCPACDGALDGKDPSHCPYCGSWLTVDDGVVIVDQIERAVGAALAADRREREQREAQDRFEALRREWHEYLDQTQKTISDIQEFGHKKYPNIEMDDLRIEEGKAIDLLRDEFGDERERIPKRIMWRRVWNWAGFVAIGVLLASQDFGTAVGAFLITSFLVSLFFKE